MVVHFLGTGTSTGVPQIGCRCEVCQSPDPKDKRLRASVWIETGNANILIDCSPDFRQQMLERPFKKIDGLLITHEHYDHVGGIDDLRPFSKYGAVDLFLEPNVAAALRSRIPYCFGTNKYIASPQIRLNEIRFPDAFQIAAIDIVPIRVMHHKLPILGYRIGNFAYLTDLKSLPEEELPKLRQLDTLVLNALQKEWHISHQNLEQAIELAMKINPRVTYFTHMSHKMGRHCEVSAQLPENIFFAHDNLSISI